MYSLNDVLNGNFENEEVSTESTVSEVISEVSEKVSDIMLMVENVNVLSCAIAVMESAGHNTSVQMEGFIDFIKDVFKEIGDFLKWIWTKIKNFFIKIKNFFSGKSKDSSDMHKSKIDFKDIFESNNMPYEEIVDIMKDYAQRASDLMDTIYGMTAGTIEIDTRFQNPFDRELGKFKARLNTIVENIEKGKDGEYSYSKDDIEKYKQILKNSDIITLCTKYTIVSKLLHDSSKDLNISPDDKVFKGDSKKVETFKRIVNNAKEASVLLMHCSKQFMKILMNVANELNDKETKIDADIQNTIATSLYGE